MDIVFFTETWLKSDRSKSTADFKDIGYHLLHSLRKYSAKCCGGGVGIVLKSNISGHVISMVKYSSFKHIIVKIPLCGSNKSGFILLICVYRLQDISICTFFDEFSDLLSNNAVLCQHLIIAGDFNIHVDISDNTTMEFNNILDVFSLKQHVSGATQTMGHTLDLIITHNDSATNVSKLNIQDVSLSDHFLLNFDYLLCIKRTYIKTISFRPLKNIDSQLFRSDVKTGLKNPPSSDFYSKIKWYNNTMKSIIDKHAPIISKEIKIKPNSPWFDTEYATLRRRRRAVERRFRKSQLEVHKQEFVRLRKLTTTMAAEKKRSYFSSHLNQCISDSKAFYSNINFLLDSKKERTLPSGSSDIDIANSFLKFFNEKIDKIRAQFESIAATQRNFDDQSNSLYRFRPATIDEIKSIVSSYPIKSSPDDPLPDLLLKLHKDIFLSAWTDIINLSLESGSVEGLKNSIITPLLKDLSSKVDSEVYKNYRPISNIVFLSKLIERVVASRLEEHMKANNLFIDNQFGYKKFHSTETLLMKVFDELLMSCDRKVPSVLILLDLSAAFDTVDHNKLLHILEFDIGIKDIALAWFKSFLIDRTQTVMINSSFSDTINFSFGVPQGSVLGPILFSVYIRGLYIPF